MGIVDLFQRRGVITEEEAEELRRRAGTPIEPEPKGITVADVQSVSPGAKVNLPTAEDLDLTKPKSCQHCNGNEHAKIVQRTWPDGRKDWACHGCGRKA
jgi:hypothetical protein